MPGSPSVTRSWLALDVLAEVGLSQTFLSLPEEGEDQGRCPGVSGEFRVWLQRQLKPLEQSARPAGNSCTALLPLRYIEDHGSSLEAAVPQYAEDKTVVEMSTPARLSSLGSRWQVFQSLDWKYLS